MRPKSKWDGPNRTLNVSSLTDQRIAEWAKEERRSVPEMMRVLLEDIVRAGLLGKISLTHLCCPKCGTLLMFDVRLQVRQKTESVVRFVSAEVPDVHEGER